MLIFNKRNQILPGEHIQGTRLALLGAEGQEQVYQNDRHRIGKNPNISSR